jgi:predicted SprT family Zn-dependent metalloprotease
MIRTYDEMQQVIRRIKQIVHKFIPDAEIEIVPAEWYYGHIRLPGYNNSDKRVNIALAQDLIERGTWEQIENTVAHEIAHALAAGRTYEEKLGHTTDWRNIARALGSSGKTKDFYEDTENPIKYKIRCADCGYTVLGAWPRAAEILSSQLGIELRPESSEMMKHIEKTGHHKWYFLDMVTGRRWTDEL